MPCTLKPNMPITRIMCKQFNIYDISGKATTVYRQTYSARDVERLSNANKDFGDPKHFTFINQEGISFATVM